MLPSLLFAAVSLAIACPAHACKGGPSPTCSARAGSPNIGVDTLKRVKAHEDSTTTSCPSGLSLVNGASVIG